MEHTCALISLSTSSPSPVGVAILLLLLLCAAAVIHSLWRRRWCLRLIDEANQCVNKTETLNAELRAQLDKDSALLQEAQELIDRQGELLRQQQEALLEGKRRNDAIFETIAAKDTERDTWRSLYNTSSVNFANAQALLLTDNERLARLLRMNGIKFKENPLVEAIKVEHGGESYPQVVNNEVEKPPVSP